MPSRINMGPDGGPYIAINENNGNIELEDNSGTTVALWDEANSQWDFKNNPINNVDSLTSNSVNTNDTNSRRVASNHHYASEYDGGDIDTRLDNAITASSDGDVIYLEKGQYQSDRTIEKSLIFIGGDSTGSFVASIINAAWVLNGRVTIRSVGLRDPGTPDTLTFNDRGELSSVSGVSSATAVASSDRVIFEKINSTMNVVFEAGTSGGIVDTSTQVNVIDNGTNTVGDIA